MKRVILTRLPDEFLALATRSLQSGQYVKAVDGNWYINIPDRGLRTMKPTENWTVQEHEDGTISAAPPNTCREIWHGIIERGIWIPNP